MMNENDLCIVLICVIAGYQCRMKFQPTKENPISQQFIDVQVLENRRHARHVASSRSDPS